MKEKQTPEMTHAELFQLLTVAEMAAYKLGLDGRGNDLSLPNEIRELASALSKGQFRAAREFVDRLPREKSFLSRWKQ